ncbi:ABC transporter substrate-binding protein [Salipiger sp. PrR002]|uniref:ABC transporter substrate-binding protein n=1 Tax=Salipiger sp. PrR002 TaxID=2706489 RepID=UPI0013BB5BD0|nr:ABC transporter substrate-binding protein [Salipiger sp. PrR002]NDW00027.1 ABC transporter substrate-binding protein [Salipiger sp. PrR002]NDW56181.1 ABC transporter substrate-binding protein [Salipiger sp. PrR004]
MKHLSILALGALLAPLGAQAETLTFAWTPNPQTPQVDVAIQKGYFEDAGLDIEFVAFRTGREGFEAMVGGQVDVTFMAEFPAAVGALTGQEFSVIGDLARFTGSRVIVNSAGGEIAAPAELAGKRIGTTIGTNVNFYLEEVLADAGVSAEIVGAAPPDLVPALARGDLDAIVPFPTFYGAAASTLGDDYAELRVPGYDVHYILAASPEMTGARAADLEAFMGALAKADADVAADPEAAMEAVSASMQGAMSPAALAGMWEDVDIGLKLDTALAELLVDEADWVLSKGVVKGEAVSLDAMLANFAPDALRKAAPDAVALP